MVELPAIQAVVSVLLVGRVPLAGLRLTAGPVSGNSAQVEARKALLRCLPVVLVPSLLGLPPDRGGDHPEQHLRDDGAGASPGWFRRCWAPQGSPPRARTRRPLAGIAVAEATTRLPGLVADTVIIWDTATAWR